MQILFSAEKVDGSDIVLPFHYQAPLQGAIYHLNQNAAFGTFLHNVGYSADGRKYRLFCFSRILEQPKHILRQKHTFVFPSKISWIVATVDNPFADSLLQTLFTDAPFTIAGQELQFCRIHILPECKDNPLHVRAMSPICVYSTIEMTDGKKRTIFYHPKEKEFTAILQRNLKRKCMARFEGEEIDDSFHMKILSQPNEVVTEYKHFVLKGYLMEMELSGSDQMLQMALCAGLGGKNAQGFGLIMPKSQWKGLT